MASEEYERGFFDGVRSEIVARVREEERRRPARELDRTALVALGAALPTLGAFHLASTIAGVSAQAMRVIVERATKPGEDGGLPLLPMMRQLVVELTKPLFAERTPKETKAAPKQPPPSGEGKGEPPSA